MGGVINLTSQGMMKQFPQQPKQQPQFPLQDRLRSMYDNIPNWQTYGQSAWNSMQTPNWMSIVGQIPDWRQMGQQVQNVYNSANQVALEDERMNRESGQMAGLSSRGILQPGFDPMRYWYAQQQAQNNAAGLQARLGVESGLRNEAFTTGQSLRDEALRQLQARYGIESGLRGEQMGALGMETDYDMKLRQLHEMINSNKTNWLDWLGPIGEVAGLGGFDWLFPKKKKKSG